MKTLREAEKETEGGWSYLPVRTPTFQVRQDRYVTVYFDEDEEVAAVIHDGGHALYIHRGWRHLEIWFVENSQGLREESDE